MADDNKRNALFGKIFGKQKPAPDPEREEESLDKIMSEDDPREIRPADDEAYADWLSEAVGAEAEGGDDLSDTIQELFGSEEELDAFIPEMIGETEEQPAFEPEYEPEAEEEYEPQASVADFSEYEEESPEAEYTAQEQTAPETDSAEDPPVDEDTATLLTALGYSDANGGVRRKQSANIGSARTRISDLSLAYGYEGREFTSHSQISEIKNAYSRDHKGVILRLAGTILFAILLAIYDAFGRKLGGALDVNVYPVINILMSLQLLLIAAAFSFKQIIAGLRGILRGEPIFHSLSAVAVLITVIYDIVIAIAAPEAFTLYNFPAAVCLLFGVGHDYFVLEREIYVFDRLSSWQSVATLERVDTAELAAELGGRGTGAEKLGGAFRLRKGEFAENYFRHINRPHPGARVINYFVIVPVLALALVMAIIALVSKHSFPEACNAFTVVSLFGLPSAMLLSMSYPFFTLVSKNLGSDAVLFSESDAGEYKSVDTVVFEEADLFDEASLTINRISVCDKNRMQDVFDIMCGVSALYDRVGGRIAGAFRASTAEGDIPEDVKVIRVDDGGFIGTAGGKNYVVGSDAYLTSQGIAVMRYYDDKYIASNPGGVVLHIAVDDAEVFKLYLTYRIPDSMLMVIGDLPDNKTRIVVRTVDPNINLDLILRILAGSFDGDLTLIRKPYDPSAQPSAFDGSQSVEGGILVNGESPEAIIDVYKNCRIFSAFSKLNFNLSLFLFGLGVLLSVLLGVLGSLIGLSSFYIFLYQVLSAAPGFILVHLTLGK